MPRDILNIKYQTLALYLIVIITLGVTVPTLYVWVSQLYSTKPNLVVETVYQVPFKDKAKFKEIYVNCAKEMNVRNIVVINTCTKRAYDILGLNLYVLRDVDSNRYYCLSKDVNEVLICRERLETMIEENIK